MRDDAKKLLCLRPRRGGNWGEGRKHNRRKEKWDNDPENAPSKASMKKYHVLHYGGKQLSEYFPAIMGFLRKSVGRHWDKVYSEICALCDKRSAIGIHMFQHLFAWVELHVVMKKGKPYYLRPYSWNGEGLVPLTQRKGWLQLYVHPKTGQLLRAPQEKRSKPAKKAKVVVKLGTLKEFRKRNGIWYYIEWALKPNRHTKWDDVRYVRAGAAPHPFDNRKTVCYTKLRQLSSKELRRHALQNG